MYCTGCAQGIQAMVKRIDGVIKVEASYEERKTVVDYEATKTSPEKIIAVIEKIGYKARVKK